MFAGVYSPQPVSWANMSQVDGPKLLQMVNPSDKQANSSNSSNESDLITVKYMKLIEMATRNESSENLDNDDAIAAEDPAGSGNTQISARRDDRDDDDDDDVEDDDDEVFEKLFQSQTRHKQPQLGPREPRAALNPPDEVQVGVWLDP